MNLETRFKTETGFDAYIDNDLRPKIYNDYYVEFLEEQLSISTTNSNSLQDRSLKIKQQELEDKMFYEHVKTEALRQINRPKGWLIDINRARLMRIYNIYDNETARYKNVDTLKMCSELIKELS